MANRAFQLQVNNLVERLTCIQIRAVMNGASQPTLIQGNGQGTYPTSAYGAVQVAGLVRTAVGVYVVTLSDAFNNLQAFEGDLSPAMTVGVAAGSYVVGSPYVINSVGTKVSTVLGTAPTGLISLTLNGLLLSFTAPGGFTAAQVAQVLVYLVNNNSLALAAFNLANGSQIAMPANSAQTAAIIYAALTGTSGQVQLTTVNPNPTVTYSVTSSSGGGTLVTTGALLPSDNWHTVGVPASVIPAAGVPFTALTVGTGGSGSVFGSIAAPAAWRVECIDPVTPGPASTTIPQTSPTLSQITGGQLIVLFRGAASALVDPDAGSTVRFQFWLRNSTVKGKGE
jgi:hypothetical protein